MAMLRRIMLKGFKSIREMDLELHPLNVMIGANGAGKSNLISFFEMLSYMMQDRLQEHIAMAGGAHSLLHYGPEITSHVETQLEFEVGCDPHEHYTYSFRLSPALDDSLVFTEETLRSLRNCCAGKPEIHSLGADHEQSQIVVDSDRGDPTAVAFRQLLDRCRVYHFHDTRYFVMYQNHSGFLYPDLRPDGSNLASFLYRLKSRNSGFGYERIVRTIRLMAPFFKDFDLQPTGPDATDILLNWRDTESNQIFGPHQLSDGTVRAICLITLLMQPDEDLPDLIIVDEPELGLHPYASNLVAALFKKASHHSQILISTQSSSFLDHFDPEDVIVVDREGKESIFRRPDPVALEAWLDEYSLGEVWEKNVIGGGPH